MLSPPPLRAPQGRSRAWRPALLAAGVALTCWLVLSARRDASAASAADLRAARLTAEWVEQQDWPKREVGGGSGWGQG